MQWALALLLISGRVVQSTEIEPSGELARYRSWRKVNSRPYSMSQQLSLLCRGPSPEELAIKEKSPHAKRWVTVYVSSLGVRPMFRRAAFPVGSQIVKEKSGGFPDRVIMSTFMIKREKGYNPECGDWEFGTLDASGKRITSRGKLKNCMPCHIGQKDKDFTFRTYMDQP